MMMEDNRRQDDLIEMLNERIISCGVADDDVLIPEGSMSF